MRGYDFIFSGKLSHRLLRHAVFWVIFLLYFYYVNFFPTKPEDLYNNEAYLEAFSLLIFFPISFISVYITIYFILPAYILTSRYLALTLAVIVFALGNFWIAYLLTMLLAKLTTSIPFDQLPITFRWFLPVRYGIGLPLTSAALTAIVKLLKTWHLQKKENEQLLQIKLKNEIQLLKTQFQPLFLYNTLHQISLLVQKQSAIVPTTLLNLSELLSYLLHEIEKDEVALEQEVQMVKNFLSLKRTFHEKKLTLRFTQEGEPERWRIAPLLLVSLVESFFAKVIDNSPKASSVTIEIYTGSSELNFVLRCQQESGGKFIESNEGDWWKASLKKIELLYPNHHRWEAFTANGETSFALMLEQFSSQPPVMAKDKPLFQNESA